MTWLNGPTAQQNPPVVSRQGARHDFRVLIVNRVAGRTNITWPVVAFRNSLYHWRAAVRAIFHSAFYASESFAHYKRMEKAGHGQQRALSPEPPQARNQSVAQ